MSVASDRAKGRATNRGRSSLNGTGNLRASSSAAARAKNSGSSSRAKNGAGRGSASEPKRTKRDAQRARSRDAQRARSRQLTPRRNHAGRKALTNAGVGLAGAVIGVAGGVLLGRGAAERDRKVLGVPVPTKIDLGGVGQQIGEAGRQFGNLASEVRTVREKAEQVGRALT